MPQYTDNLINHTNFITLCKIIFLTFSVAYISVGCATTTSGPYWQNAAWENELQDRIIAQMHYPIEATNNGFPTGTAKVEFTYSNKHLTDIRIVRSTQSQILDDAVVQQLAKVKAPDVAPQYRNVPHRMETEIELAPSIEDFREYLLAHVLHTLAVRPDTYPDRPAKISVEISYRNGSIIDKDIFSTSGSNDDYNTQVISAVSNLKFPPTPPMFTGQKFTLKFRVWICKYGSVQAVGGSVQQILENMVEQQHELPTIFVSPPDSTQ